MRSVERSSGGAAYAGTGPDSADPDQKEGGLGACEGALLEAVAQRAQRGGFSSLAAFQGAFRTAAQQLLRRVALQSSQPGSKSGHATP